VKPCRACSYTPQTEPKVFCPACGAMWDKAKPPSPKRKDKAPAPKPVAKKPVTVSNADAYKIVKPVTKTSGKQKRNPTKKKG